MTVIYTKQGMQINLHSASPEALHEGLTKGIVANLKAQMVSDSPITPEMKTSNHYLLQLLESLLPDEHELEKLKA